MFQWQLQVTVTDGLTKLTTTSDDWRSSLSSGCSTKPSLQLSRMIGRQQRTIDARGVTRLLQNGDIDVRDVLRTVMLVNTHVKTATVYSSSDTSQFVVTSVGRTSAANRVAENTTLADRRLIHMIDMYPVHDELIFLPQICSPAVRPSTFWQRTANGTDFDFDIHGALRLQGKAAFSRQIVVFTMSAGGLPWSQCNVSQMTPAAHLCDVAHTECYARTPAVGVSIGAYDCCCAADPSVCLDGQLLEKYRQLNGSGTEMSPPNFAAVCQGKVDVSQTMRLVLFCINTVCLFIAIAMAILVRQKRSAAQQQYGARGWALMELLLIGAALLYCITIVQFWSVPARVPACALEMWARELGFAVFYGAIVLKIFRNLIEYRVRKAHHVYVKEKDMLKYLLSVVLVTVTGLLAWTFTWLQPNEAHKDGLSPLFDTFGDGWSQPTVFVCKWQHWSYAWHAYEYIFLLYGLWLCYKARSTTWVERWQFTFAVALEMVASVFTICIKYMVDIWPNTMPDINMLVTFLYIHATVTVNLFVITFPKFYYISLDYPDRPAATTGGRNVTGTRKNPWVRVRDDMENGKIDFAMVPIHEMNPEDIRAELKRIYTELRMHKLKNLYQDNPHISRKKKQKTTDGKEGKGGRTTNNRRQSTQQSHVSPSMLVKKAHERNRLNDQEERGSMLYSSVEIGRPALIITEDACSTSHSQVGLSCTAGVSGINDLTVESGPANLWVSRTGSQQAKRLNLEAANSIRV